jgi:hypothetical protein
MASLGTEIIDHTKSLKTPDGDKAVIIVCGVLNLFLFGIGTIIAGAMSNNLADVIIGILQLVIPFVGWIWSVVWGVIMISRAVAK